MRVLGVSALYHDSAAALIEDGHIVAAAQKERFHRLDDEPIVGSPEDAFRCFMGTGLDVPAVGNCYLRKENRNPVLKQNYDMAFELD